MPVVTAVVFHPPSGRGTLALGRGVLGGDLAFVAISLGGGLLLARLVP